MGCSSSSGESVFLCNNFFMDIMIFALVFMLILGITLGILRHFQIIGKN